MWIQPIMSDQKYYTDNPTHPGEQLRDTLDSSGISQTELANRIGMSRKVINEIITGKAPIKSSTAILLERILKVPAHIWNNLQRNYDLNMAYLEENMKIEGEIYLVDQFPIRQMINNGWIPECRSKVEKAKTLLSFFGVSSIQNIENSLCVQFRRSFRENTSKEAVYAWLRQGEIEIKKRDIEEFDKNDLKSRLIELRKLTNHDPDKFEPEIIRICAEAGVAVVFIQELPNTHINGATFWFDNNKRAGLLLSLRFKTNDHLWFSFFHELGHILLHNKRDAILDINNSDLSDKELLKEKQADTFAQRILISKRDWEVIRAQAPFSGKKVRDFARSIGIAPGIVVGRLQKEKLIQYSNLNQLKERYKWSEN